MKALLTQLMQGIPLAALLAAGFTLGTLYLDFGTDAPTSALRESRSCVLPDAFRSENSPGGTQVDARAFIAFLQACRP